MDSTVGKLVIGLGLASTVNQDGEKAKADARKLKKEMDKIFITPSHSPSTQPLTHMADSGQWKRYSDAMHRQTQADKYASMEMFGTPAMGALANMPRSAFISMAMGSWEKNRGIQLRSQIQVADEISKREARLAKEAERVRLKEIARKNQEWREAQRQQSNAARMDPANNLRRGFVGGMFGSPVGTASTIGMSAMVGAAAGFMGGMAASMVISGIGRIKDAIIGLGKGAISTASNIEMLRMRLETITKGQGDLFFKRIMDTAIELRSPVEGLIKSFSKMTAMGFQPTMEQLKGLVNYTRMLGDPENMDYIALAFSQIASKGKLEMQELRQLGERSVPALEIIMEKLNVPENKIGDIGKLFIPGVKAVNALMDGISERIGNVEEEYRKTMQGMIDYTKLLWFQFTKDMGDAGMYEAFKSLLSDLIKVMESDGFKDMAKDIGAAFTVLLKGLSDIVTMIKGNWDWLGPLFKYLTWPGQLMTAGNMYRNAKDKSGGYDLTEEGVQEYVKKAAVRNSDKARKEQKHSVVQEALFNSFITNAQSDSMKRSSVGLFKVIDDVNSYYDSMKEAAMKLPEAFIEWGKDWVEYLRANDLEQTTRKYYEDFTESLQDLLLDLNASIGDRYTRDIHKWNKKMEALIKELNDAPDDYDGRKAAAIKEATETRDKGVTAIKAKHLEGLYADADDAMQGFIDNFASFKDDIAKLILTPLEYAVKQIDEQAKQRLIQGMDPKEVSRWQNLAINDAMRENRPEPTQLSAYVVGTEAANRMQYGGTSQNTFSTIAKNTGETSKEITKLRESIERKRSEPVSGASQDILDAFGL